MLVYTRASSPSTSNFHQVPSSVQFVITPSIPVTNAPYMSQVTATSVVSLSRSRAVEPSAISRANVSSITPSPSESTFSTAVMTASAARSSIVASSIVAFSTRATSGTFSSVAFSSTVASSIVAFSTRATSGTASSAAVSSIVASSIVAFSTTATSGTISLAAVSMQMGSSCAAGFPASIEYGTMESDPIVY